MQNKNFDGIKYRKIKNLKPKPHLSVRAPVDGITRPRPALSQTQKSYQLKPVSIPATRRFNFWQARWLPMALTFAAVFASFILGAYFTWSAGDIEAQDKDQILPAQVQAPANPPIPTAIAVSTAGEAMGPISQAPNEALFSLTLDQLESYLAQIFKTPEMKEAERLAERKIKLKAYLQARKSPFAEIVDTLAELKHWKIVLAVSNSESSLGKRCYTNNCTGIGVEPGHPLWQEYASKAEWAKDMDRLIEKRYKDWTLEEMNGVYNKPGSQNWLLASKQVLEELQERGIE